jgi:hypothetical protein
MDKEQYAYTLNSLQADSASLESAAASLQYLRANREELTTELLEAFSGLAAACKAFLDVYTT